MCPENTAYFDAITDARSLLVSEEDSLHGVSLISLETCADLQEDNFSVFVENNFASFMRLIRSLQPEAQELLLGYYLLHQSQTTLGKFLHVTQTVCSTKLRLAVKAIGSLIMMDKPSEEMIHEILEAAGCEGTLKKLETRIHRSDEDAVKLSRLIFEYRECRSFAALAYKYDVHRPDVRRMMRQAFKTLLDSEEPQQIALGAYIFSMVDNANPNGRGLLKRREKRAGHIYKKDPDILGSFRADMQSPDFHHFFISKADN